MFAVFTLLVDIAAEEGLLVGAVAGHRTHPFAHAPVRHHLAGDPRGLLQIVFCARRIFAEDELLRGAAGEDEGQAVIEVGLADVHAVFLGHKLRHAQGPAARDDRHLVKLVDARQQPGGQRMAGLVVSRHLLFAAGEQFFPLWPHQHLVAGVVEVGGIDCVFVIAGGPERGLVDEVADVGAGEADGAAGLPFEVDIGGEWHIPRVHLEERQAGLLVGAVDGDVAVEAARSQEGGIEHVGAVRGGKNDHRLGWAEAVHLAEDLVECLLAFVVAAAEPGAANTADGVDLVDEEDRR